MHDDRQSTPEQAFAARLREAREAHQMTQAQLSRLLEVTHGVKIDPTSIARMENGKRMVRFNEAVAIADILDMRVYDLIRPEHFVTTDPAGVQEEIARVRAELEDLNARLQDVEVGLQDAEKDLRSARSSAAELRRLRDRAEARLAALTAPSGFTGRGWKGPMPERQPIVAAVVTSELGVLVGRRNDRTPPWGFITGEVEPGEQPEDAAQREVKEGTGLEIRIGQRIGERDHPVTGRHMIYLAGRPVRGTLVFVRDEAELADVKWASLAEAVELIPDMFRPVREYLEQALGGER